MGIFLKTLTFVFVLGHCVNVLHGGRILVMQLVPSGSYTNLVTSVVDVLAPYHQITLYSATHKEYNHPNVTLKRVQLPPLNFVCNDRLIELLPTMSMSELVQDTVMSLSDDYIAGIMNSASFQELLTSKTRYDVLITYIPLSEFIIPFVYTLQASLVQLVPSLPYPWQNEAIGTPNFFTTDPSMLCDESSEYFMDRLKRFFKHAKAMIRYNWFYLPHINAIVQKYFPPGTPSVQQIMKKTSLLLVNTHEAMGYARPILSNSIEIGGVHCKSPNPLPVELETFLQGSGENGVIYFSFGSTIAATFPKTFPRAVLNVFKKLPYRILWKWNEDIDNLPANVKVSKWLPQQNILGHNKTRLFITHGGMLSLQESVYHGVPVLSLPICYDQPSNARLIQELGYGRYFKFLDFTEEKFLSEINEVISNSKYKENVQKISLLMKDEQCNSSNKIQWWIEYIIRHKGFPLHRSSVEQSWFKTVDTDIVLLGLLIIISLYYTIILICTMLKKIISRTGVKNKLL